MAKDTMKIKWKSLSCVRLFATPWTVQSMEFSRPGYKSGWPFPFPGDLPNPGIKPRSPTLQVSSLLAEPPGKPKSTGVGGLSLLQQIFLTQELNRGLLHCWATREALFTLSFSTIFISFISKLFYCVHAIAKYFILFVNFAVSNVLP